MFLSKLKILFFVVSFMLVYNTFAANLNFNQKMMLIGKASLSESGYVVSRTIGVANFSPELRLPIQLTYASWSDQQGVFGEKWNAPQLESRTLKTNDALIWVTPWGEKIEFHKWGVRQLPNSDLGNLKHDSGFPYYAKLSSWVAEDATGDNSWKIVGVGENKGWEFSYVSGCLTAIVSSQGNSLKFKYDGSLLRSIEQNGIVFVAIEYNSSSLIESIRVNEITTNFNYNDMATIILPKTIAGKSQEVTLEYLTKISIGKLNPVEYSYSKYGYIKKITQGEFSEYIKVETETESERIANLRNPSNSAKVAGRILSDKELNYSYDNTLPGHVILTDKLGNKAFYAYNYKSGDLNIVDFNDKKITISYFMRFDVSYMGKIKKIADGNGLILASYIYDNATGKIKSFRDKLRNETIFSYDKQGNLAELSRRILGSGEIEPLARYTYNDNNMQTQVSALDENGLSIQTTRTFYDKSNRPIKITSDRGTVKLSYNSFGYPVTIENPFGQTVTNEYDEYNNLISTTDIYGVKTSIKRNECGLTEQIAKRDGKDTLTELNISYDTNGLPIKYRTQDGNETSLTRDELGRVTAEILPDETEVKYFYNDLGKLAQVTDQNNNPILFNWNLHGMDSKTTAENQITEYLYNDKGLVETVNAHFADHSEADRTIKYEYDLYERPVKITYGTGEVETISYDAMGRIASATRGDKKITFKYDFFGNMVEKNEDGLVTKNKYNSYGQRTQRHTTLPNGRELTETRKYDNFGRLIFQKDNTDMVFYFYNDKNQLERQEVNGNIVDYTYTKYGQLESKKLRLPNSK